MTSRPKFISTEPVVAFHYHVLSHQEDCRVKGQIVAQSFWGGILRRSEKTPGAVATVLKIRREFKREFLIL